MSYRVAVVGATGNVGREMLNILEERQFPVSEVIALASNRSAGKEVSFGEKTLRIQALEDYDFTGTDIALFAAGSPVSTEFAPIAAKARSLAPARGSGLSADESQQLVLVAGVVGKVAVFLYDRLIAAGRHR